MKHEIHIELGGLNEEVMAFVIDEAKTKVENSGRSKTFDAIRLDTRGSNLTGRKLMRGDGLGI